jgi:diguanylate cyclase (GGDEF)-like protein
MAAQLQRPADIFARYGGEEFVAVVGSSDDDEVARVAERLRVAVEHLAIPHAASHVSAVVTVTVGACSILPTDTRTMDDLILCADLALYEGKKRGRNQVVIGEHGDPDDPAPAR